MGVFFLLSISPCMRPPSLLLFIVEIENPYINVAESATKYDFV